MHQSDGREHGGAKRRVVVTGLGVVSATGTGVQELWRGLLTRESSIRRITRFDASHSPAQIAAEVDRFDPSPFLDSKSLRRMDRCSQFAVHASGLAIEDSCLDMTREDRSRIGVCIGSALGGAGFAEHQHTQYIQQGVRAVELHLALQMFVGAGTCCTAIRFGLSGLSTANADSCASGTIAIGNALHAIQRGDADVMLAGGAEAPLAPLCHGAFALIRALSTRNDDPQRACRPFDRDRDGFVMGEGAAVLVLEERERAIQRGAPIYAEVIGFAVTNDAHHMTVPRPDGESASCCISLAMQNAGIQPDELDYINAHASSTQLNDSTETLAIKRALAEHAYRIPISGTKPYHGHALGATGAIEAVICCLALQKQTIPPTLNLDNPDPQCDLDYVPGDFRQKTLRTVLSNSFGFGGINACLILKKEEEK
jgi:3-oxoacyl-[acyl-carrier-protein] synthase II